MTYHAHVSFTSSHVCHVGGKLTRVFVVLNGLVRPIETFADVIASSAKDAAFDARQPCARGEDAPRGYQELICVATLVSSNVLELLLPKHTSASRI